VVTEPFRDWVLEGEFPLGRPDWQNAGARFVDHIEPFENRKLWLLNGSHSLLAYAGQLRGHETVAEAIADETCLEWVEDFWNEAVQHLPAEEGGSILKEVKALGRFRNGKIAHRLAQIAIDGSNKLRVRIAPVAKAELAAGRDAQGCARVIRAWVDFVIAKTGRVEDSQAQAILQVYSSTRDLEVDREQLASRLVAIIDSELAESDEFMNLVLNRTKV
jgi:fructuronate reductase